MLVMSHMNHLINSKACFRPTMLKLVPLAKVRFGFDTFPFVLRVLYTGLLLRVYRSMYLPFTGYVGGIQICTQLYVEMCTYAHSVLEFGSAPTVGFQRSRYLLQTAQPSATILFHEMCVSETME